MKIDGGLMTTDLRDAARLAVHAERLGYDGLWTAEAGHDPYLPAPLAARLRGQVLQVQPDAALLQPGAARLPAAPGLHRGFESLHVPASRRARRRLPYPSLPLDEVHPGDRAAERRGGAHQGGPPAR